MIKRYADALSATGDFYVFVRTLEAYEKSLSGKTELVLTTDNDFLRQLKHLGEAKLSALVRRYHSLSR